MKKRSLMTIAVGTGALVAGCFGLLMNGMTGAFIGAVLGGVFSGAIVSSFKPDERHL